MIFILMTCENDQEKMDQYNIFVNIAIVDDGGILCYLRRQNDAFLLSIDFVSCPCKKKKGKVFSRYTLSN